MRLIRLSMICLLLFPPSGGAIAQDTNAADRLYRDTIAAIEQRIDVESLLAQCPADLHGGRFVTHRDYHSPCSKDPAACLELCLGRDRPDACFAIAVFFQQREQSGDRVPEILFARACEAGSSAGCTNRAAGMMLRGEASAAMPSGSETLGQCAVRSYRQSCLDGDSWGCTMYGAELYAGQNTERNPDAARRALNEACTIWPESKSCGYAIQILDAIEREDPSNEGGR